MTKTTTMPASPTAETDHVTVHAQALEVAAARLLRALRGDPTTVRPAALAAIRQAVLTLELCTGQIGDTLHEKAIEQDSDLWDHTAIHLYNTVSNLHDAQALVASAQITLDRALREDADDEPDGHRG